MTAPKSELHGPGPHASHQALADHVLALKAEGRLDEALVVEEQAIARFPRSAVAWHNYAATLGDLGRGGASKAACERAMAMGLDGPQTWSVYARALLANGEHDAAEAAYGETLKRAPQDVRVASELANIVWMRRGRLAEAEAVLNACFAAGGDPRDLLATAAELSDAAGEPVRAADLMAGAARRMPADNFMALAASERALAVDRLADAQRLVAQAEALAPQDPAVLNQAVIVHLAAGQADQALAKAKAGVALYPQDQSLLGWAATAARAAGDPLHGALYNYEAMVGAYDIVAPEGWSSLRQFLDDLSKSLDRLHLYAQHPANQSLRHGSQTLHLLTGSDDPVIQAFFRAVDAPIRAHMAALGAGQGPLRSRNSGDYRIAGAWSVRLRPGGFHKDHFHSQGWLSSAFYVQTPDAALDHADRQGWIRFGQPPFKTTPPLPAEYFVRPRPGRLVLFPSYMWHGTVPFTTDERRMTIAFDIVPK